MVGTMKAYVGVYTARLEMPWVRSLKEKRALVRPVMERLKARFPVSAARLGGLDAHGWEIVGFTVIGSDPAWIEQIIQQAATFLSQNGAYHVCAEQVFVEAVELEAHTN
ncbi:protein of unknown function DUF503 [Marinithermus hydrothermalis DSM 14884]|uniref:DUF503 domain-containing protein n=2 Tax=Marinithermus TaxID=186191 RepID=F2NMB0_MARHT|nr:protein of unknown function DUF503 [Marinithermus hydrothermalis DSM 14884]